MSGESTDSESPPTPDQQRSRSLLRQVRDTLSGRSLSQSRSESKYRSLPTPSLVENSLAFDQLQLRNGTGKPRSKNTAKTGTPVSFSHRLSLLNQFKSHLIGHRKYRQTSPTVWTDEAERLLASTRTLPVSDAPCKWQNMRYLSKKSRQLNSCSEMQQKVLFSLSLSIFSVTNARSS